MSLLRQEWKFVVVVAIATLTAFVGLTAALDLLASPRLPPTPTPLPRIAIETSPTPNAMATGVAQNQRILYDMATVIAADATAAAGSRTATWAAGRQTKEAGRWTGTSS